ncbi:MAG: phosphatidate cytidylyltransferase [Lachnospiraceae bacterium]|nr:phosphatidate cytidylyltransferase [Lachnospiraceae bacterium]
MFKVRAVSGVILVAIALATILAGGPVLIVTLLFCSVMGMQEYFKATGAAEGRIDQFGKISPLTAAAFLGAVCYYVLLFLGQEKWYGPEIVLTLLLILAVYVFTFPKYKAPQVAAVFFGLVYVAVMLGFIYLTRAEENGQITVWLIFLSSWGADTCAYLAGRAFGKHKMAPVLSPKKSVEGAVGGVIGAGILGVIFSLAFNGGEMMAVYLITCACGALISMIGDLAASAVKRDHGIKDYGTLIPGHGGILDRFDSVIFTAPVIYCLTQLLM